MSFDPKLASFNYLTPKENAALIQSSLYFKSIYDKTKIWWQTLMEIRAGTTCILHYIV